MIPDVEKTNLENRSRVWCARYIACNTVGGPDSRPPRDTINFHRSATGRLELPLLRHLPRRGEHSSVPASARGGPRPERQARHEGGRLGGTHGIRRDLCAVLAIRIAAIVDNIGSSIVTRFTYTAVY